VLGPASHLILFHYVVEGGFQLRVEGKAGDVVLLGAGEVVLMPRNDLHLMGTDLRLPPVMSSEIIQPPKNGGLFTIRHGGNGACTRMICGFIGCDGAENNPVLATLPPALKLSLEQGGAAEWIQCFARPGGGHGRLRIRGCIFPRVQEDDRHGAGYVATFASLGPSGPTNRELSPDHIHRRTQIDMTVPTCLGARPCSGNARFGA
jgi:hypothetical protein